MSILTADGALLTRDGKLLKSSGSGGGIYIPAPASAAVGQIVKVKAVDAAGKITETEAVDLPSGDLEFVQSFMLSPEVGEYELADTALYKRIRVNIERDELSSSLGTGNMYVRLKKKGELTQCPLQVITSGYGKRYAFFEVSAGKNYAISTGIATGNNKNTLTTGIGNAVLCTPDGLFGHWSESEKITIGNLIENADNCLITMVYTKPMECIDGTEKVCVFGEKR